jgi:Family of unknown function (DUF6353)
MDMSNIFATVVKTLKSNSPEILTALGVGGVIATSYLTTKATAKSIRVIDDMEENDGYAPSNKDRIKERVRLVWKNYIPPVISGAVTIGCIVGSNRVNGNRTAAAVAAYSLTERAFSEYKDKVAEEFGENKEQKIRDDIARDKVLNNPSREVMITTVSGHVLCCELYTGRYLRSDMESLRKAQNDLNAILISQIRASLDDFYDLIHIPYTSNSCRLGWDSDKLMELKFSTVVADSGEPCLAFEYNYVQPIWE